VRSCPTSIARDPDQLVSYLEKIADTDLEKARAIYVWLAENISYDAKSINKNKYGDNTALGVLKSGKAVCQGYAKLFEFLGNKMGLNIQFVSGYSKNDVQEESWDFDGEECDHAWNMIKIDDEWRVFDATWGAGNGNDDVRGRLVFTKEYSDNWFDLSPYEAIFSHYPEDTSLILTEPRLTLDKFESLSLFQFIPLHPIC
jgi:transglutaminase/protease-like cytokinesis protein 3